MLPIEAIAVIGKDNNPLFIKKCLNQSLKYDFIAHTTCDIILERVGEKKNDLYLGLLSALEDLAVFGYMSNTGIKFVLMLTMQDATIKDQDVKIVFKQLHEAYSKVSIYQF
ncbi:Sedlin [Globomyces pollinis-pini]|nr:Sedlin [Globomyces pollinis-pini]